MEQVYLAFITENKIDKEINRVIIIIISISFSVEHISFILAVSILLSSSFNMIWNAINLFNKNTFQKLR